MDVIALIMGMCFGVFAFVFWLEGTKKEFRFMLGCFLVSQLFWIGWFLPEKTIVETQTTDYYNNMRFSRPVTITKTVIYRPLAELSKRETIEIVCD